VVSIIYAIAVIVFGACFFLLKIIKTCNTIFSTTLQAIETLANHLLDDQIKQQSLQKYSLAVLKNFLLLLIKTSILFLATLFPLYFGDHYSVVSFQESVLFALRADVILITVFASAMLYFFYRKLISKSLDSKSADPNSENSLEVNYSRLERVIHNIYFSATGLQNILFNLEKKFLYKNWKNISAEQPIFLTSLPRSGTTILLESLSQLPNLASNTYRDMPFIFSPVLWSKFSLAFQRKSVKKPRIHGDGILVNEDSPEAFEETIWLKYFPQKYTANRIYLWKNSDSKFKYFFHDYMQRIIFLRNPNQFKKARYLSKNNSNIARIPALLGMFPDAIILVLVRDPFEQAASLHRQHMNFLEQHKTDDFVKKYMADIGHFEFGELHRVIDFPEVDHLHADLKPETCDYWLAYWLAAFQYLNQCDGITFISYAKLCRDSENYLSKLCKILNIEASSEAIHHAAQNIASPMQLEQKTIFSEPLSLQAKELYEKLLEKSV